MPQTQEAPNKRRAPQMSEDYTFEAWKNRVRRTALINQAIAVSKSGNLTVSDDLFEKHFSLEYATVEIFVDPKLKAIGLKPSNEKIFGFPFHKIGTAKKAKVLYTKKLVVLNDIEPNIYPAKWSDKYGMVIFNYHTLTEHLAEG